MKTELRKMRIADDILAAIIAIGKVVENDPKLAEDIEEEYGVLRESFKRKNEGQSNG